MITNEELNKCFEDVKNGKVQAFETVYNEFMTPVYVIALRVTHNHHISEDIAHDVFVNLFSSPPDLNKVKNLRAWIFQMVHNIAVDRIKKSMPDEIPEDFSDEIDIFENINLSYDIDKAFKLIPDDECKIVIMHINGNLKFREVADILQIPLGTVLWKYNKAISKLRLLMTGG